MEGKGISEVKSTLFSKKLMKVKDEQVMCCCSNRHVRHRSRSWLRTKDTKLHLERVESDVTAGQPGRGVHHAVRHTELPPVQPLPLC